VLRSNDMEGIAELKRQGMSITAIGGVTGFDRKTVHKYLAKADEVPKYGPRVARPSKLDVIGSPRSQEFEKHPERHSEADAAGSHQKISHATKDSSYLGYAGTLGCVGQESSKRIGRAPPDSPTSNP
jgi:hypothetical protein